MNDVDMLEGLALRLIQGMEELKVNWWVFNGWSIRRLHQLALESDMHGSGSPDNEHEPSPEGGVETEMAPGLDDGDGIGRTNVRLPHVVRSSRSAKKQLKATKKPKRLARGPGRRLRRRGWR